MFKQCFISFWLIFIVAHTYADTLPTHLYGKHSDYKNQVIKLFGYKDYITQTEELLSADTANARGQFDIAVDLYKTRLVFVELGIYRGVLYIEPGKKYEVVLPEFKPLTKAEQLNPYFKPVEVYLGVKNSSPNDLNLRIAEFNDVYNSFLNDNYYQIFKSPDKAKIDTAITTIEHIFDTIPNAYFYNYRKYKYAWLKYVSYLRETRYIAREYFHKQPILYQNIAYMDLFNQVFADYLSYYMDTKEGERLFSDVVYAKSPTLIKETFANNLVLINDTLQQFVLLKGLHDAFYGKDFPLKSLLITLDSVYISTQVPEHAHIAQNIRKKTLKTRKGYPAPGFELETANGSMATKKDYASHFVYLSFVSVESFACQQDFELLKKLKEAHPNDFKIVSISIDDDFQQAIDYFKEHGYTWDLLSYKSQPSIIQDYNVRAYPTYFLINKKGNFSMSPAPSPAENFEWYFFNMMQEHRRQELRNQERH